jgi:hypothetical protein
VIALRNLPPPTENRLRETGWARNVEEHFLRRLRVNELSITCERAALTAKVQRKHLYSDIQYDFMRKVDSSASKKRGMSVPRRPVEEVPDDHRDVLIVPGPLGRVGLTTGLGVEGFAPTIRGMFWFRKGDTRSLSNRNDMTSAL